uniref:N-acetyltransferase domain-containing protein n=1 Tax=Paramormyrops kingsleyae TaxID=1676925 RepID=A0A3B3R511_9TELE
RIYRDEDFETVREVYATGFAEHLHAVYLQVLKQLWVQLTLASIFIALLASSGSLLLSILGGIQLGLNEDLQDIRKSYMQGDRSCFWVAELQGVIGGTVGILSAKDEPGCWELKRISVRKEFRGQGMAKALCKTALDFVINQGVEDVVLYTSMVQTDAHQLYRSVGFRMVETFVWPSLPAKLINFMVLKY